jgi:hypothetical protein
MHSRQAGFGSREEPGTTWRVEVVVAGRDQRAVSSAHAKLAEQVKLIGFDLDALNPEIIEFLSIATSEGPGMRFWVTIEVPDPDATGAPTEPAS